MPKWREFLPIKRMDLKYTNTCDSSYVLARDPESDGWLEFVSPEVVLSSSKIGEVKSVIREAERLSVANNLWVAGWISYEAAAAFDPQLPGGLGEDKPLVWFAAFKEPKRVESVPVPQSKQMLSWWPMMGEAQYRAAFSRVHEHIARGDTYQANLSFRLRAFEINDPYALFYAMNEHQAGRYSFYIKTDRFAVCSASPELFFEKEGDLVTCRPMKGTGKRGADSFADEEGVKALACSDKERAENVMIVDMIRNDLGRIAIDRSVRVDRLFEVERYPGVLQMVSEVKAKSDFAVSEIISALFPSASITGAPKRRTMEILSELESSERNIYTGSVGVLAPGGHAWFNVAIRTAMVDLVTRVGEYGVGSGIVWDSSWENERKECLLKAEAAGIRVAKPDLFETILWTPEGGFWLLERHLARLSASSEFFGYPCDLKKIVAELEHSIEPHQGASKSQPLRVKLSVDYSGGIFVELHSAPVGVADYTLSLASMCIDPEDPRFRHKTVERSIYDDAVPSCSGAHDVLLWNNRGEVTESKIANIVVSLGGVLYTPPVSSGLLPGCFRAELLEAGRIKERLITLSDLRVAESISLINSVRGMWPARLLLERDGDFDTFHLESGCR